jgi:two-component system chemotaxis sensor kinase CheA
MSETNSTDESSTDEVIPVVPESAFGKYSAIQRLGELLVEQGKVSREDLALAIQDQQFDAARRIGDIFVEHGVLEHKDIADALYKQLQNYTKPLQNDFVSVRLDDMVSLIEGLDQITGDPPNGEPALSYKDRLDLLDELRAKVLAMLQHPVNIVFETLPRLAYQTSDACGKMIDFRMSSDDFDLDHRTLRTLEPVFQEVVLNAVIHGIEEPDIRRSKGKDIQGSVSIEVRKNADYISFLIKDDGQGIDYERIREFVIKKGILGYEDTRHLSKDQLIGFLTSTGYAKQSTMIAVSSCKNLHEARNLVEDIGGNFLVDSEPDRGTAIRIVVPRSPNLI